MTDTLAIDTGTSGLCRMLNLRGTLDLATVAVLRDALARVGLRAGDRLIVDLGAVEFCDSAGMSGLIAARNHAIAEHAEFAMTAVPRHILVAFRVVGLDQVFTIYPTVSAAIDAHHTGGANNE